MRDVAILIKRLLPRLPSVGKGKNDLHRAASSGDVDKVKELIAAGYDIDATDQLGKTALFIAAEEGSAEMVNILLNALADFSIADKSARTAIAVAKDYGQVDVEKILQEAGGYIQTVTLTEKGSRPFSYQGEWIKCGGDLLGRGRYGFVYRGTCDNKDVAVKRILLDNLEKDDDKEENFLTKYQHANVLKLFHTETNETFK